MGGSATPGCHTSRAKKLRYMSKIAAIFARADNTRLSCTQPIANLLMACLYVFPVLLLAFFHNANSYRTWPMSYFAIDSLIESVLNSIDFAQFRFGAVSSV